MILEAEDYAEEDRLLRERVDSRNGLESYLYGIKNSLEGTSIDVEDKQDLLDLVEETMDWLEVNPDASKDEIDNHKNEVEQIVIPLMRQVYSGTTSNDNDDFDDGDL
jgi:heat shock protein 5